MCWIQSIVHRRSSLFGWTCSQTSPRTHLAAHKALRCHINLSLGLGQLPDMSWRPCSGSPRNSWPTLQEQRYTTCWPLETSRHTWTLGGDATVLDDYALTTTTMTTSFYNTPRDDDLWMFAGLVQHLWRSLWVQRNWPTAYRLRVDAKSVDSWNLGHVDSMCTVHVKDERQSSDYGLLWNLVACLHWPSLACYSNISGSFWHAIYRQEA